MAELGLLSTPQSVCLERDFYRQLLALNAQSELGPLVESALSLIMEVTSALGAYLELGTSDETRRWCRARGFHDRELEHVRASISRGIIAEAVATGKAIRSASALTDPRFQALKSVRRNEISAVLCVPIGGPPPLGVVYLQGRRAGGPFQEEDEQRAQLLARQLAPLADRLLAQAARASCEDHTREARERLACNGIIGRSEALGRALAQAALVAPLAIPVLITGASGTGKSALAEVIARHPERAAAPFVELNCAALPEALLESELFGAVRGAHSTATRPIAGKVAAAEGGTLFLDEIAELTLGSQAKLLQLLQSGVYYPLGASTPSRARVRILSATNVDLRAAVSARRFREDLYYRLHVVPIEMPALSQRREDIPLLVTRFVAAAAERHGLAPRNASPAALLACCEADWPGNIRQLAHALEAATIRAHGERSSEVEVHHVFAERASDVASGVSFQARTRAFQGQLLRATLDRHDWNVSAAARELELTRAHVYNLINLHQLCRAEPGAGRAGRLSVS